MEYVTCPRCNRENPATQLRCSGCGAVMPKRTTAPPAGHDSAPSPPTEPSAPAGTGGPDPFAGFDPGVAQNTDAHSLVVCLPDGRCIHVAGDRPLLLGRDPEWSPVATSCTDNISWHHAEVRIGTHGPVVVDCHSTNGTFVGHHRLAPGIEHPVQPGDEIRLSGDPPLRLRITSSENGASTGGRP